MMKKTVLFVLSAALVVLLPACDTSVDAKRFASLQNTVHELVRSEVRRLEGIRESIAKQASDRGNRPEDLRIVQQSGSAYNATQGVLGLLDSLQKAFVGKTGQATNSPASVSYNRRINPSREHGEVLDRLERELGNLVAILNHSGNGRPKGIMLPGGPLARLREGETSLAAALAHVWELKLETVSYALASVETLSEALVKGRQMVVFPLVDAPTVLSEGDSLHISVSLRGMMSAPPTIPLAMTCNGKPLVVENGMGKVRFIAQGPPGKKHWEAAIRVKIFDRDTVFRATQTYWVLPQ